VFYSQNVRVKEEALEFSSLPRAVCLWVPNMVLSIENLGGNNDSRTVKEIIGLNFSKCYLRVPQIFFFSKSLKTAPKF